MIKSYFKIEDWKITIFITKNKYKLKPITEELWKLGCLSSLASEALKNINEGKHNIGFTYSNYSIKRSLMFIGLQDSEEQLINTIAHESRHLQLHIAMYKSLDLNGESVCYLLGHIVLIIYTICKNNNIL